jgi:predicted membrane-bound spermidine synthase
MGKVSVSGRSGLLAIFVLSGFAGLIYQSIWSRYLGLFLGHAAYAQALVLAIFMGGMAAGAAWVARAGQGWRNLVRGYAIIEAVIGVLGLVFHGVFNGVLGFSYEWLIPQLGSSTAVEIARWVIAALLILPQTILLGMTFPLMSGGLMRRFPGSDGRLLGGLYFTNSIGAALGALVSVFVLLPTLGLPGAMAVAALLNFVVAGLALYLAREPEALPAPAVAARDGATQATLRNNPLLRTVLLATALSGAASFAYEIVWIRMLSMAVGSTMHAFELMLASFIAGIALGGLWVSRRADAAPVPLRLAGWMQVCMGLAALASLWVYSNAFEWVGWMMDALAKSDGGYQLFNLGTGTIAIAIMLPAAFFAGTTLPLFTVTLLRAGQGERSIGRVYAWNTLGSILGVFAAIHWLIPATGLKNALCIAAAVDMAIGLYLLHVARTPAAATGALPQARRQTALRLGAAAVLSAVALLLALRVEFDPQRLASGVFRYGQAALALTDRTVQYYRDGKTASISVLGYPDSRVLISTNGKPDASVMMDDQKPAADDEPTMALAALVPLSMLDAPKRVGVIGFGSGMTTHTLLGDPRIERVDTIEIEPAMVEGAKLFGPRVARAYSDPRSHIIIDDAKAVFAASRTQYDLIISEPSNPWISGVGALFSQEFYQFIPRHISQGGLFVQWLQTYEIDEELVGSILNALAPHFDDYGVWLSNGSDLLIVASPRGPLPASKLGPLLAQAPELRAEMARLGIRQQADLDFHKIANAPLLRGLAGTFNSLPVNSDFRPILGLDAPRTRYRGIVADHIAGLPIQATLLLEAVGVRQPLPTAVEPFHVPHFKANAVTTRARMMALELRGQPVGYKTQPWMNGQEVAPATLLKAAAPLACRAQLDDSQWSQLSHRVRDVSAITISMLPPELLQDLWVRPAWLPCAAPTHPDLARLFALLAASAQRDWPAMEQQGRDWLTRPVANTSLHQDFADWALQTVLLSLAQRQQWAALKEAESTLGSQVKSQGVARLNRTLLVKIAQQQLATQ